MLFEDIIFQFLLMSAKMIFWSIKYTWVTKPKWLGINQHLSSKTISGVSLKFTAFVQLEIPGRCTLVELWRQNVTWQPIFTSVDGRIDMIIKLFCISKKPERKKLDMYTKTRSRLIITFVNNAKSTMT